MAVFDADSPWMHPLDYRLAAQGPACLYWSREVLDRHLGALITEGYRVVTVDASSWRGEQDMHTGIARALSFPDYYGRNLNALNDCLRDVSGCAYGFSAEETGLVLVIEGYDTFLVRSPEIAHYLVNSYADAARLAALVGNRMLCLLHSHDPDLVVPNVGASRVGWNPDEFLNAKRHP